MKFIFSTPQILGWSNRKMRREVHIALLGENSIKMYLKEIGWEDVDWIHQAQDRDLW
jgi:hypothetical protein